MTSIPTNEQTNVYVESIQTGAVTLESVNQAGTAGGNAGSGLGSFADFPGGLAFSPNSEFLLFRSLATDLTPGVTTSNRNLYVRNLLTNRTVLATPNTAGTDGANGDADTTSIAVLAPTGSTSRLRIWRATSSPATTTASTTCSCATSSTARRAGFGAQPTTSRRVPRV